MAAEAAATRSAQAGGGQAGWRIAAILLFLGVPFAAAGLAGFALTEGLDSAQVADHAEETARAIIHQLDRRPGARQQPVDTAARFLASANAGLARAELQALAGRLVEQGGGRVIELQSMDPGEADPANHVSIDVTFAVSNAGLLDILYAAETGLPLLTVPRLDVRSETATDGSAAAGQVLHVTMTLQGTWKGGAP